MTTSTQATPQGFAEPHPERLPLLTAAAMSDAQRQAAQALIDGPRKAVFGPFIPLMHSPELMHRVGKVGEYLRFESILDARIRELVTCYASRHVSNQFEWLMHAPLALKAGVVQSTLDAIANGKRPQQAAADEMVVLDFAAEMLQHHGVCDATYAEALTLLGEQGVVELASLIGYFVMICWVMNLARTPALPVQGDVPFNALAAFPS